ncbi:MAG: hypothetical protein J6U06_05790, partial [Spirochaetaceae bacterium]|nr:hypothetical protein [Spirochaetaceae bacterium]
ASDKIRKQCTKAQNCAPVHTPASFRRKLGVSPVIKSESSIQKPKNWHLYIRPQVSERKLGVSPDKSQIKNKTSCETLWLENLLKSVYSIFS